jgi:hypothetical protein
VAEIPEAEAPRLKITERMVLKKFDGELTPEQAEYAMPTEVLVLEDGELVDHWTPDQQRPWPRS